MKTTIDPKRLARRNAIQLGWISAAVTILLAMQIVEWLTR